MDKLLFRTSAPAPVKATATATATAKVVEKEPIAIGPRSHKVHVYLRQMGSKWVTTVEDLDEDLDLKRIARYMAKAFASAVTVCDNDAGALYLKLQGNKKDDIRTWLVANEVMTAKEADERLVFHGV